MFFLFPRRFHDGYASEIEEQQAKEALLNVFEAGLREPLKTTCQLTLQHRIFRAIFKGKCNTGETVLSLERADFPTNIFPRGWHEAYVNQRPTLRKVIFPVKVCLFLSKSPKLYDTQGI